MLIDFPLVAAQRLAVRLRCSAVALCWSFAGLALSLLAMDAAGATGLLGRSDSAAVVENAQIRAELLAHAPQGLGPGRPFLLGLQLRHASGWHTYWKNPGDSGLATELQWTLPAGWQAAAIQWPLPQRIQIGDLANYGYEGTVLLPVPLTVAPGFKDEQLSVRLKASWLVCRRECIPQEGEFVLNVPAHSSYAAQGAAFEAARKASPQRERSRMMVRPITTTTSVSPVQ